MAAHKSAQYPFQWPDGSWHSRPAHNQPRPINNPAIFGHGPSGVFAPKPPPKPKPVAPAPAGPTAPTGQPFVGDSTYLNDVNLADRELSATNANLDRQEQNIKFDYGLEDPTNPNSQAAALKRAFLARGNADINGAGQHLFAGSTKRAIERTRRDQEFANADLHRRYEDALAGVREQRTAAGFNNEQTKAQEMKDAIDRAPAAEGKLPVPASAKKVKHPAKPKVKHPAKPKSHKPRPINNPTIFGGGPSGRFKPKKKKH